MVRRIFFKYKDDVYFVYFSYTINYYEITYPDVYLDKNGQKSFTLWENPEGYFISEHYLYYAYGKDYYHTRIFGAFLTGHSLFVYQNYKDYKYARMNLDILKNEEISKKQFEEEYNMLRH